MRKKERKKEKNVESVGKKERGVIMRQAGGLIQTRRGILREREQEREGKTDNGLI